MPKVHVALDGFSEVDAITTIVPIYEGDSFPVSFSIVDGDFGIHNDNYTIDSGGVLRVLVKPDDPIQNFVRYRITTDHDSCQWVENFLQIFWSDTDFTPQVSKYSENPLSTEFSVDNNGDVVAFINNMPDMPISAEFVLRASYNNDDVPFTASLFSINDLGEISVLDIYSLIPDREYRFSVRVTDPNTLATYHTDICIGPFNIDSPTVGAILDAAVCQTTTPEGQGFNIVYDCSELQPDYPDNLSAAKKNYYEVNCLTSDLPVPRYSVVYEPLTTDFLEARRYTVSMSGLDSEINSPQIIDFPQGQSLVSFNLTGDIKTITALRSAESFTVTFITTNNDIIITSNLHYREGLTDPLLDRFVETVAGYTSDFVYRIRSLQSEGFSDDHGQYIRNNGACYGRLGAILNRTPDHYLVPNGGDFTNSTDCLGG